MSHEVCAERGRRRLLSELSQFTVRALCTHKPTDCPPASGLNPRLGLELRSSAPSVNIEYSVPVFGIQYSVFGVWYVSTVAGSVFSAQCSRRKLRNHLPAQWQAQCSRGNSAHPAQWQARCPVLSAQCSVFSTAAGSQRTTAHVRPESSVYGRDCAGFLPVYVRGASDD